MKTRLNAYFMAFLMTMFSGCATVIGTRTSFVSWQGDKLYVGEGGAVEVIDGIEFWSHGEPSKTYKVVGIINQTKSDDAFDNLLFGKFNRNQVIELVKTNNGDGVVLLDSGRFISGYSTTIPKINSGTVSTSPEYSNTSVLAVFRYTQP